MTEPSTMPSAISDIDADAHLDLSVPGPGVAEQDAPDSVDTVGLDHEFAENALPVVPPTKREREAEWMRSALEVQDLSELPMAELRVLVNNMFRLLDADRPPTDAAERYGAAVAEIEARSRRQAVGGLPDTRRQVFKDSSFSSRFELYLDGSLAAYIRYALVGGQLTLRLLVETPGFESRGLAPVLMRHAMLHAHKRRLSVIPGCAAARAFLEQNPQYRALARLAH